ncbi:MAG: Flp pilus assembly complex ATPase component TadA [Sedimentisphaerales bacterium]|nr:Flp pilus assembly complex ATPase component TadA [Sedimentisphaerales bacterium]
MELTIPFVLAVTYGGYVSPIKLAIVLVFFFLWMPLVNWTYKDTQEVQTKTEQWTTAMILAGAIGLLVWILIPVFLIGFLLYLVVLGATSLAYVVHRNARVAEFEKILTADHIKNIFINQKKRMEKATRGLTLVTANGNEVPMPLPKTTEAIGFQMICELFEDAMWRRASDILFQPGQQDYSVTYIVDGMPMKQPARSREDMEHFIHFIKHMADLEVEERRKPQIGKFRIDKGADRIKWEVLTAGSTAGEQLKVSRVQEYGTRTVEDMGFQPKQVEAVKGLRKLNKGVIVLTAPPKNGITTTMYAFLRNHDLYMNNVNTVEKKLAADLQNITQHVYSPSDTGTTTYAKKVQSVLRMGPEIIGIADCEDKQCVQLACAAGRDGVIVYPTMQATSVLQALSRWLQMAEDKDMAIETLAGILNQRLIRILCEDCKQAYQPNQDLLRKFNIPADKIEVLYRPGEIEYDKHGKPIVCEKCQGTGFYGRTGVFEMIVIDESLRAALKKAKSIKEMGALFRKAGMLYLQEQCIKKVAQGITSINEVIRHFSQKAETNEKQKNGNQ